MNQQQLQERSDKTTSFLIKALAIIGLAAIIALIAWIVVQGVRSIPRSNEGIEAAVTGVSSVFRSPGEAPGIVAFTLDRYTYQHNVESKISWSYSGESTNPEFLFSYACKPGVLLGVRMGAAWVNLACDTPLLLATPEITIRPTATAQRFNDVTLTVASENDSATTVIGIVNVDILTDESVSQTGTQNTTTNTVTTQTPPPTITVPVTPPKVITPTGPADLSVSIEETGVLESVMGRDTFFPISPIPINREGAVRFVVSNVGGATSGSWVFTANLPIEGDANYLYVSPLQAGLVPGARVEFTLSFDEILDASKGTIRVSIDPSDAYDSIYNNTDSVVISIDR